MKAIVNTKLVLIDRLVLDGVVLFDGERIVDFGDNRNVQIPKGTKIIDAGGDYTAPGFVDIHCHGGGGHWFHRDPEAAARHFLCHGETTVLPTLYINLTLDDYIRAFNTIAAAMKKGAGRIIYGVYMEGPYLNPKYGCDISHNRWTGEIDVKQSQKLLGAAGDLVKVWGIAPERMGIDRFVRDAKKEGVIFSAAHSEATPEQVYRFVPHGLKLQTHHMNATGICGGRAGVRTPGVDEAVWLCDDIYAELICDSLAIHVSPHMLKLAVKNKGKDKIILISDSTEFGFMPADDMKGASDLRFDQDGSLAGSALTLDAACRNMMMHTGAGICDVVRYASLNPAKLLGLDDRIGRIEKGYKANLVIMDDIMTVKQVFFEGEQVESPSAL